MKNFNEIEYKEFFELLPDAVVLVDITTNLPFIYNKMAYTQLEYEKDEFEKISVLNYEAIKNPKLTQKYIENIKNNKQDDFETKHITKYGKILDIRVRISLKIIQEKEYLLCMFRDISEQKRLKESQERLEVATESANIGVWEYDALSNSLIWDKQMYEIYGISPEDFTGVYDAWLSALHPDDLQYNKAMFAKALEGSQLLFKAEFRIIHPNGTIRYIKVKSKIKKDCDGKVIKMIGVNFDITKLKETEKALKINEGNFRGIFERANCGIVFGDSIGKLLFFNDYFVSLVKYSPQELENMRFTELNHPDDNVIELSLFKEILSQKRETYRISKRFICKDKEIIWVDLAVSVIRDENSNPINYVAVVVDITEQKKLEQSLQDSKKRFSDIADASGEYIWELDENAQYIFLTNHFKDMLGYTIEESLGKTPFDFMPKEEQQQVSDNFFKEIILKRNSFRGLIHPSLTKDGKKIWQKVNGLPIFDANGKIIGYRGASLDITSEKKAQEELEIAKEQAESANRAKTDFLANMSHEIRTPMNAIIGLGDILEDMIIEKKQKDLLYKINSSSKMLLGIINDILDYSKIEAGKLELECNKFTVEDVLSQLKVLFEQRVSQKDLELYFHLKGKSVGLIYGDELRLTQVLSNLLSNAIKFTNIGNITLKIEFIENIDNEKVTLNFSIEDSGIGMNKEQLNNLFKPFSQADNSITRKYGGTGLGLIISKNIINAMGGNIEVQSKEEVGTKFSFAVDFKVDSCKKSQSNINYNSEKILIVDDQEISREVLKDMLKRFGYSFDEALDGFEAIKLIQKADSQNTPYDMLVIDWNMPLLNGVKTIEKLQNMYNQKELKSKIPTIFMISAYSKTDIDLENLNINCFISKPVTPSSLFDAIYDAKGGYIKKPIKQETQKTPDLSAIHILVMEDNEINQEVLSLMLDKVGISYEIANNGKIGIEKFLEKQDKFDLILMDIQMPIIGGYEATQKIREVNKEIPIIALTAAAMVEDKEKAIQVGMNDHIGKPIDKNELYRSISKLMKRDAVFTKSIKISKDTILDLDALYDITSSKQLAYKLLEKLKTQLESGEFKDIVNHIKNNTPQSRALIHSLKGVSGNIKANEIFSITQKIDKKFQQKEVVSEALLQELQYSVRRFLEEFNSLNLEAIQNKNIQTLNPKELQILVKETFLLIQDGTLLEQDTIEILYENLQNKIDSKELLQWKNFIEQFEFDEAISIMKKWDITS